MYSDPGYSSGKQDLSRLLYNITAARGGGSGVVYIDLGTSFPSSEDPPDDLPGSQASQAPGSPRSPRDPRLPRPQDLPGPRISEIPGFPRPQDLPGSQESQASQAPASPRIPPVALLTPVAGRFPSIWAHRWRPTASQVGAPGPRPRHSGDRCHEASWAPMDSFWSIFYPL